MPQEAFGRHDDEGLFKGAFHLPTEDMKELGGGREVADLNVVFGTATSLEPDANIGLPTNQQYETILHPEPERKKSKLEVTNELEVGDTFPDFQLQSTSGPMRVLR